MDCRAGSGLVLKTNLPLISVDFWQIADSAKGGSKGLGKVEASPHSFTWKQGNSKCRLMFLRWGGTRVKIEFNLLGQFRDQKESC